MTLLLRFGRAMVQRVAHGGLDVLLQPGQPGAELGVKVLLRQGAQLGLELRAHQADKLLGQSLAIW